MQILKKLTETFFPNSFTCDICGVETFDGNLCPDCKKTVTFNFETRCPVCGRKTETAQICLECKAQVPIYKRAVSPLVYEGGAILLIARFKNGGAYLKEYLSSLLAKAAEELPKYDCITYVPMTKKAKKRRGYHQTKLLAACLAERTGVPAVDALEKIRETEVQKGLSRKERANNLKACFKIRDKSLVKGKSVLLVDDVLTTGATADEASRVLLKAGAAQVLVATVASVEYKMIAQKDNKPTD